MLLVQGRDLAHAAPDGVGDAGKALKCGVDLEKNIVMSATAAVELNLDHTEALIECIEDGAIAELAATRFRNDR